jgi:alpha-aminoadipic semialdehyde synthase
MAVDNLPCQLPAESSEHFGDTLVRWVPTLSRCPWDKPLDELPLPEVLLRAIITHHGRLTPRYAYLQQQLDAVS